MRFEVMNYEIVHTIHRKSFVIDIKRVRLHVLPEAQRARPHAAHAQHKAARGW